MGADVTLRLAMGVTDVILKPGRGARASFLGLAEGHGRHS